jgi:hypothetical protein
MAIKRLLTAGTPEELIKKLKESVPGDLVVYGFDPRRVSPNEVAAAMERIAANVPPCQRPPMALYLQDDGDECPWAKPWTRVWAREFVNGHTDAMRLLIDEPTARSAGWPLDTFAGVGRLRIAVMSGLGSITKYDDGSVGLDLDDEGLALLAGLRGDHYGGAS